MSESPTRKIPTEGWSFWESHLLVIGPLTWNHLTSTENQFLSAVVSAALLLLKAIYDSWNKNLAEETGQELVRCWCWILGNAFPRRVFVSHEICLPTSNVHILSKGSRPWNIVCVTYNAGLMVGRIWMKVNRHNLMGGMSPELNIKSMSWASIYFCSGSTTHSLWGLR